VTVSPGAAECVGAGCCGAAAFVGSSGCVTCVLEMGLIMVSSKRIYRPETRRPLGSKPPPREGVQYKAPGIDAFACRYVADEIGGSLRQVMITKVSEKWKHKPPALESPMTDPNPGPCLSSRGRNSYLVDFLVSD
jgi:hypothetical protein